IIQPPKVTYAEIEFLDAPGLTGKGRQASGLEVGPELRQTDALIVVVDAFSPEANPRRDIRDVFDEMMLADQVLVEGSIERKEKKIQLTGDKSETRELELLKQALALLEQQEPLIDLDLSEEDARLLRGYMFLTRKPLLIVLNISEEKLPEADQLASDYRELVLPGKCEVAALCGQIEMELASLDKEDQKAFLDDLGIAAPAMETVIRMSYRLLGLVSFISVEGPELRAWPVKKGTIAHRAAGVVHSDIERGFIRAETTAYEDFIQYKTPAALKAAGKTRLEGKDYVVQDGDIIRFRFNV
ncbi:MAG: DUF933 domain-containing protein, partial [Candidatus Zixiibacteriota bacterium]